MWKWRSTKGGAHQPPRDVELVAAAGVDRRADRLDHAVGDQDVVPLPAVGQVGAAQDQVGLHGGSPCLRRRQHAGRRHGGQQVVALARRLDFGKLDQSTRERGIPPSPRLRGRVKRSIAHEVRGAHDGKRADGGRHELGRGQRSQPAEWNVAPEVGHRIAVGVLDESGLDRHALEAEGTLVQRSAWRGSRASHTPMRRAGGPERQTTARAAAGRCRDAIAAAPARPAPPPSRRESGPGRPPRQGDRMHKRADQACCASPNLTCRSALALAVGLHQRLRVGRAAGHQHQRQDLTAGRAASGRAGRARRRRRSAAAAAARRRRRRTAARPAAPCPGARRRTRPARCRSSRGR